MLFSRCLFFLLCAMLSWIACAREGGSLFDDLPKRKAGPQMLHEAQSLPDLIQQAETEPQIIPKQKTQAPSDNDSSLKSGSDAKQAPTTQKLTAQDSSMQEPKRNAQEPLTQNLTTQDTLTKKDKNHLEEWSLCWKCHDSQSLEKTVPPFVKTERTKIATLRFSEKFPSHAHPLSEDCFSCHKVQIRTHAGTPTEKKFTHAQHLDGIERTALAEECLLCHNQRRESMQTEREIFAESTCQKCHGNKMLLVKRFETKQNPLFHHKEHTKVEGGCVVCHPLDLEQNPTIQADCKLCHDHWKKKDPSAFLNACVDCHLAAEVWKAIKKP